jgi:hypothetical protein
VAQHQAEKCKVLRLLRKMSPLSIFLCAPPLSPSLPPGPPRNMWRREGGREAGREDWHRRWGLTRYPAREGGGGVVRALVAVGTGGVGMGRGRTRASRRRLDVL